MSAVKKAIEDLKGAGLAIWDADEEYERTTVAAAASAREAFGRAVAIIALSIRNGGKLQAFGAGGSASNAQRITAELVVRYMRDRKAIGALALTTDTAALRVCANDLGYEQIFSC